LVRYTAVLLLLLTAGCASVTRDPPVSQPEVVATQPATPEPAGKPVTPATPQPAPAAVPAPSAATPATPAAGKDAPPIARTPAPIARTPAPVARTPAPSIARATTPAAPPVAAPSLPAAPLTLDLNALEAQLKATKAIGIFTKIALKNQVGDLMKQFREYYQGKTKVTMTELRRSYDLLMMKVLSLLQDSDQKLASAIVSSREAIWGLLADPKKFATLQG
jgi:hypothetical protein